MRLVLVPRSQEVLHSDHSEGSQLKQAKSIIQVAQTVVCRIGSITIKRFWSNVQYLYPIQYNILVLDKSVIFRSIVFSMDC